jgi:hypothetical protein
MILSTPLQTNERNEEMNAEKLAVVLGLMYQYKCTCGTKHSEPCNPCMKVPITEIDGVKKLKCQIELNLKHHIVSIQIDAGFKHYINSGDNPILYRRSKISKGDEKLTHAQLLEFSTKILTDIPLLKLQFGGSFEIHEPVNVAIHKGIDDIFGSIASSNVVVDCMKECCVCYEKTKTKTPCKHHLCNRCWSNIDIVSGDDEDDEEMPCPICRENIQCI